MHIIKLDKDQNIKKGKDKASVYISFITIIMKVSLCKEFDNLCSSFKFDLYNHSVDKSFYYSHFDKQTAY